MQSEAYLFFDYFWLRF